MDNTTSQTTNTNKIYTKTKQILMVFTWPILAILTSYFLYLASCYVSELLWPSYANKIANILYFLLQFTSPLLIYWLFIRIINFASKQVLVFLENYPTTEAIVNFISNSLKIIILLSMIAFAIDYAPIPAQYIDLTNHLTSVLIIATITWIVIKLINLAEQIITLRYTNMQQNNLLAKKTKTQVIILKRIIITVVIIVAIGTMLISFENVRALGKSLLTSAGIVSVIVGVAAQKPLNNLIIGLQLAFSQTLKINDFLIIEKEFGQIEEINLYYVVIKLWDWRRLILPTSYFIEKPFENLSYTSTEIIGIIMLYVDYSIPINSLREELQKIVQASPLWSKKLCKLDISAAKESTLELRILVSANNPNESWDLRCEIREKLIQFIHANYPTSLPQIRMGMLET